MIAVDDIMSQPNVDKKVRNRDICLNCGHTTNIRRIDGKYILSEIGSLVNLEKGFFFTVKDCLTHPGDSIRTFITSDRRKLMKPVLYVVITSLIYSLIENFLLFEAPYFNPAASDPSATTSIFNWVTANYGYANLLMAIFIAGFIRLLFRKHRFNIFEILILLFYVMGTGMLILLGFGIVDWLTDVRILNYGVITGFIYTGWAIGQFFERKKFLSYLKGFSAYILGNLIFYFTLFLIGFTIDNFL